MAGKSDEEMRQVKKHSQPEIDQNSTGNLSY
jgi:hypothetical protein